MLRRSTRLPRSSMRPRMRRFSLYIHVTHWRNARPAKGGLSPTHFDIAW